LISNAFDDCWGLAESLNAGNGIHSCLDAKGAAAFTAPVKRRDHSTAFRGLQSMRAAAGVLASRFLGQHRPLWVNIEPTHRCNLSCSYCDKSGAGGPEMTEVQLLSLLDDLHTFGTLSVCFDGGEPLAHRGLAAALERAKGHGMRTSLSTNGLLIPWQLEAMRYVDVIKVSIDGPPEIHDAGRGAGTYAKALAGIRCAQQMGIAVAIRMTLANHNSRAHRHVLELARELSVQALFQPAVGSLVHAAEAPDDESPQTLAYRTTMLELHAAKAQGQPVGNEYVCLDHLAHFPDSTRVAFCAGGRIEVAIGPDGGMFPCGRVGRESRAPNVFELGVATAFASVQRPSDCANCWCTLTLGNCFAYGLSPRLLEGRILPPRPISATPAQSDASASRVRLPLV
jgi:MoaA/NifB/PqqE/SkfB family radical SAM enzyme